MHKHLASRASARRSSIVQVVRSGLRKASVSCRTIRGGEAGLHFSHMDVSQHGSFTALTAMRLQRPQRSFAGSSSGARVLRVVSIDVDKLNTWIPTLRN